MPVHYVTYKGIKFPPAYNSEHSLSFAHNEFLVRDDDVFNVTYPKSGTAGVAEGGGETGGVCCGYQGKVCGRK